MKKAILIILAVFLCSFMAAAAQETEEDVVSLNFETVGELFPWGADAADVYEFLTNFEMEIEVEEDEIYGKTISASAVNDEQGFIYVFYFDDESEKLWEIECVAAAYSQDLYEQNVVNLYTYYGFQTGEPYKHDVIEASMSDFDDHLTIADDTTITVLAACDETEDSYPQIGIYLFDREYFEANF